MRRLGITRPLLFAGLAVVAVAAAAATSCDVYTRASFDLPVGADYRVRTYRVRTPLRIAGETAREMGPHPSRAEPVGADRGYETWLVREDRRLVQVFDGIPRPAAARNDGRFYAYLASGGSPVLRVVRVRDGHAVAYAVPRPAYVFWEAPDLVRLVERDPAGAITFLHEIRVDPAFLAGG